MGLLSEALRIAPRDPLILSGFALVQVREDHVFGENTDAAESVARATIEEVVRIAPQMAEPHSASGRPRFLGRRGPKRWPDRSR
ncbi:MAG: hypothetical protein U0235_18655 [Polyangiaceae bacterium]